jgi:anti-anti-sigma factor
MEHPAGEVWVGTLNHTIYIRVQGRATHLHGPHLRELAKEMIQRGATRFELDLGLCTYMDSTFLGVLVGISQSLEQAGHPKLALSRIGPRNAELFRTLGVERFFLMENPGTALSTLPVAAKPLPLELASDALWAGTILHAHQVLVEADERNAPRFKELLTFLEEDLGKTLPTSRAIKRRVPVWRQ